MKQFTSFSHSAGEFLLDPLWSSFLFRDIFVFLEKNSDYVISNGCIELDNSKTSDFFVCIENCAIFLLKETYAHPSDKELSKYGPRYEKIIIKESIYKVNIRTSVSGKLSYALYLAIEFVRKAKTENRPLLLKWI
jgi:hypothetical protein